MNNEPSTSTTLNLWFQGLIYFLLGFLGPVQALYSTNAELTTRNIMAAVIGGAISGFAALKAFMSTTYSDSGAGQQPKEMIVANTAADPVPTEAIEPKPKPKSKRIT